MTIGSQLPKHISRVAVIGAGPGGLVAANALRNEGTFESIVIYERHSQVGGIWIYSADTGIPPPIPSTDCFHVDSVNNQQLPQSSAVYDNLHTNLPREVMAFRDEPFPAGTPMYPSHEMVLAYLQHYARVKELGTLIRYDTNVVKVEPVGEGWQVTSKTIGQFPHQNIEHFDAVVVATGQDVVPFIPDIKGFVNTRDTYWLHSRDYRRPDPFVNKTVLVIGGGFSATDIVRETSAVAKTVYNSVRSESVLTKHVRRYEKSNVQHVGGIQRYDAETKEWECEGGKKVSQVDVVIFATGYMFSFPFFPMEMQKDLLVDGRKVHHLHEFEFYKRNPTLAFIGLLIHVVPFVTAQAQAIAAARVWNGKIKLPPFDAEAPEKSSNDRHDFLMKPEEEFDYIDRINAWSEGYQGNLADWQSNNQVTGPLSEEYKAMRLAILELRVKHLGY